MKRRLVNLLTALSLTLCVAVVALWVRSYWVSDRLRGEYLVHDGLPADEDPSDPWFHLNKVDWYVYPDCGRLYVGRYAWGHLHSRMEDLTKVRPGWRYQPWRPPHHPRSAKGPLRWIGVSIDSDRGDGTPWTTSSCWVVVPLWLLAIPFAVLPAARGVARLRRRWRKHRAGLCPQCGYDLRATPERCPECGTMAGPPARPAT